jgi:alpha-L-arabinofuranosidase
MPPFKSQPNNPKRIKEMKAIQSIKSNSGRIINGLLLIIALPVFMACTETPRDTYRITGQTTAKTPVSPLLYSHFIEVGFGYQIAPMQAERFFNRSFEPFMPYNGNTKNSFGLLVRGGPYITDWSGEAWYHNGYEHNSWYAAPGVANNPSVITDENTFFITKSPVMAVRLELEPGGCGHGVQSIRILNDEKQKWGGLAQDGKYLEQGKTYLFSGFLKSVSGSGQVEIRLYPKGNWDDALFTKKLTLTQAYEKYNCEIPFPGPTSEVTFALFIAPGSIVEADAFSLVPADQFYGWKPSVVAAAERVHPGLIRFPGGCFASFYDWKKAVGDPDTRQPEPSFYWGGQNSNDLGTDEMCMLCRKIGSEVMLCVNLYHPNKKGYLDWEGYKKEHPSYDMPDFTDPEKGIRNAADWVAYCNLKAGESPMADWRVKNGYPEPFHVKYWEMDNEMSRWFTPEEYAREVVKYSRAMKAVDPSIKIGMISYDTGDEIVKMLEIAGKDIDFLADRDDDEEGRLDRMLDIINHYNTANGTSIKYCDTEWQVHLYGAKNPKDEVDPRYLYGHKTKIKRAMVLGTWYCGLKAAGYLMNWQRKGDIVDFVNFNNFSNTHGQAVIESPKEGAYLTAPGRVYELLSRTPARWPLVIEGYRADRTDMFQVQAAYSLNRDTLVLYALNRSDSARAIQFDYSLLDKKYKSVNFSMLDADDIFARNKIDLPDEIRRKDWAEKQRGYKLNLDCPPRSFIQAVLVKE